MSEIIRPQFTYSPEGELTFRINLRDNTEDYDQDSAKQTIKNRRSLLEEVSEVGGVELDITNENAVVSVDVAKRFSKSFKDEDDPDIGDFLRNISLTLPFSPDDADDRVLGLEHLSYFGAHGIVNTHFQRWLNSEEAISEEVSLRSALAMALPFGKDITKEVKRTFKYRSDGENQLASGMYFRILAQHEEFGLYKAEQNDQQHIETNGEVSWRNLVISTLGDCACWGSNYEDRRTLWVQGSEKKLYKILPHNVDVARQSLSLVLGMGVLTHEASRYEGHEDIFADANWQEPRIYNINP